MKMLVRTRIAPSPTGYPHIGTIYQAMFDFVFARKYNGQFLVRIEDTDRARFVENAEDVIFNSFEWFGFISDENPRKGGQYAPYRQSERLEIYQKYAQELIQKGHAYYCFCTKERLEELRSQQQKEKKAPMYDKRCLFLPKEEIEKNLQEKMPYVIRLNVPKDEKITVHDAIAGEVVFDSSQIDDQVLIKSDGFPTYHLAVVVDDYLMKITHVFRGTEWLPSTPKHILLYRFFGWEDVMPKFAHLPLLLDAEGGGKLSKRKGNASVDFYKQEGFLPEAILNFMANIVWNHPDGTEIFSLKEFEKAFELEPFKVDVKPQGARFDLKKLEWMNGEYIRLMSDDHLAKRIEEYLVSIQWKQAQEPETQEKITKLVPLVKERMKKLGDFVLLTDFIFEKPEYEKEIFQKVTRKSHPEDSSEGSKDLKNIAVEVLNTLENLPKPWNPKDFEMAFRGLSEKLGLSASEMFQYIRVIVSGQTVTPPLFESIEILGEEETLKRAREVINFL